MNQKTFIDYEKIVLDKTPLIDVRAPIEYTKGSFINSTNLPLMNDEERRLVGITYKDQGSDEALKLGYNLVSGSIKQERINAWATHINQYPNSIIYCFRGGMRSKITQDWIKEELGVEVPFIEGGFKGFRNFLIQQMEPQNVKSLPTIITGYTGSGKTNILKQYNNFINLEGLANHRGSSFGHYITPQPSQINFENNLAYELIQRKNCKYILLEDEGENIGKSYIPKTLYNYFCQGKLIILDVPIADRVENTLNEYVIEAQNEYQQIYADNGLEKWNEYITTSLTNIKKRLGSERYTKILNSYQEAYKYQLTTSEYSYHQNWIELLLKDYYDPMYQYGISKTTKQIIFKGNKTEVIEYLNTYFKN